MFVNSCKYHLLVNVAAKENEEWFAENIKYTEIEKSYEKYQYQRVIAGLSGFANAMGDDLDLDEEDDEEDFFFWFGDLTNLLYTRAIIVVVLLLV